MDKLPLPARKFGFSVSGEGKSTVLTDHRFFSHAASCVKMSGLEPEMARRRRGSAGRA
jgi:hypothetical protein